MKRSLHTLILNRLAHYSGATDTLQINAAKEIIQELALYGLSRHGLFKAAAFCGGTCLRIMYGLQRFSEDLDFSLLKPDSAFSLGTLLEPLCNELSAWGIELEAVDRSKLDSAIQKAFLKTSSLGAVLKLTHPINPSQKFNVKLEIDTNPAAGAVVESKLCEFPSDFYVLCHDQPSLFSGKIHGLLCRPYLKGRDWYDLTKYLAWKTEINLPYLRNALAQTGPFQNVAGLDITPGWVITQLTDKINSLDIAALRTDTQPFLEDDSEITIWSREYFSQKLARYAEARAAA